MAIKVKRQEMQVEQELAEKLKELGLEIEFPIDDENKNCEDEEEEREDQE